VSVETSTAMGIDRLLDAARAGDDAAFQALVAPHLRALHLHSYRMLGSYHDAEEALQDTLLRAWQGLAGYEGRAPLRHWLYRITTTTCLKMINRKARDPITTTLDVAWLQPYPDTLLDQLTDPDADPAAIVDQRENVALAFIAALQVLPATQRAVLILREVLSFTAQQVADLLDTTVPAVNSALQRARATLTHTQTSRTSLARRPDSARERQVIEAFLRAWHANDIPALAALLRDDITLTMPPQALAFGGRDAVAEFFATVPADGRLDLIELVEVHANGHPALAAYLPDTSGQCRGYGIMTLTVTADIDGDRVATITGFPDPDLFPAFGLPTTH
jgi:RNA polymerase sigma-70 factor (ECF subfamily)